MGATSFILKAMWQYESKDFDCDEKVAHFDISLENNVFSRTSSNERTMMELMRIVNEDLEAMDCE